MHEKSGSIMPHAIEQATANMTKLREAFVVTQNEENSFSDPRLAVTDDEIIADIRANSRRLWDWQQRR